MNAHPQSRVRRGVPTAGQFAAAEAAEGDVKLLPKDSPDWDAYPNTLAGIEARREDSIMYYRSNFAGQVCESSGNRLQQQWHRGERVERQRSTHRGFVQGTFRCGRCGAHPLVEAPWSVNQARVGYLWTFSEHIVPAG